MKKLLLIIAIFFPTNIFAIEFDGKFIQGHFILGKTDPNSKIIIDKKDVKVSDDGYFVFGIDRDRKFDVLITKITNGKSEKIIKVLGNELTIKNVKLEKRKHFVGIRPEHLTLNENQEFNFTPKIELIENLGNEKIVYMVSENNRLCAKISSDIQINNEFGFNLKNVLLFDENGLRIRY